MSSELKTRWITALVAIAVVAWGLFSSSVVPLYFIALFVGVVACWEASYLVKVPVDHRVVLIISVALMLLSGASADLSLFFFSVMVPLIYQGVRLLGDVPFVPAMVFPSVYVGAPFSFALYQKRAGHIWFLVAVAVCVWVGDAAAYFVGRSLGKRLLHPVSPKKTVEGALGGLMAGALAFAVVAVFFMGWGLLKSVLVGMLLNVAGQLGDLFESYLKRKAGVKDSGSLFPGHGGALDRIDSLLFALALSALFCS